MPSKTKRVRQELVRRVGLELGREISAQTVFFHEVAARKLGLNATDTRCFDLIVRSPDSEITAGHLGRATGLTTGAITGILDRLEAAGLAERSRPPEDRRKVFVRPTPGAAEKVGALYESLGKAMIKLTASYKTNELALIEDFLERNLQILRDRMTEE